MIASGTYWRGIEEIPFTTDVDERLAESVVFFTPSAFDVLYVRQDLYDSTERVRDIKSGLVDLERMGFAEATVRTAISERETGSTIGPYEFTVRFHDDGFVVRVIEGDHGAFSSRPTA